MTCVLGALQLTGYFPNHWYMHTFASRTTVFTFKSVDGQHPGAMLPNPQGKLSKVSTDRRTACSCPFAVASC